MIAAITNFTWRFLSLSWLTGPIFDKELRVSSRRRRNYLTRSLYLVLLTLFVALFWAQEMRYGPSSSLYRVSHMARVGKTVITCIVWFQFIAVQIVAGVMLSTSISDEVYNRTLGVLMTTPINSFQIVTGKLLSKLLQTMILMAITLPMLAVVRVFGGVPWDYLLAGVSITLTTVIFTGAVSLFYSIFSKRAYIVIILTILTLAVIYALIPFLAAISTRIFSRTGPPDKFMIAVLYPNPYFALAMATQKMHFARAGAPMPGYYWYAHCAIVLTASAALLALSVTLVRKVALAQIGGRSIRPSRKPHPAGTSRDSSTSSAADTRIRRVTDHPVIWKETCLPLFGRNRIITLTMIFIVLAIALFTYALVDREDIFDEEGVHMAYCIIYFLIGLLFTVVLPATAITSEKEARSWPLLLATTLDDHQILLGKLIGAVRRILPAWIPLFAHLAVFAVCGFIHPAAIFQIALIVTGIILMFAGSGIFFSTFYKKTTTAVIMNIALALTLWALLPFLMVMGTIASQGSDDLFELYINTHPFTQIVIILEATVSAASPLDYNWIEFETGAIETTLMLILGLFFYCVPAAFFAAMAKTQFRERIFHAG